MADVNFGGSPMVDGSVFFKKPKPTEKVLIIGGCGYIGSATYLHLINEGYQVDTMDLEWFGNHVNPKNIKKDYAAITKEEVDRYDVIFLCAGHSSVKMCQSDPYGAFENNVANFVRLLQLIDKQKLIYASSSCVYDGGPMPGTENRREFYPSDHLTLTKTTIERYAKLSGKNCYGLRFGSVNGWSPSLRMDLMINAMTISAINQGLVTISSPNAHRPILGMRDLTRAVEAVIREKEAFPGCYNVFSFNGRIFDIGLSVGSRFGAQFKVLDGGTTYDFTMEHNAFQVFFEWKPQQRVDDICDSLADMLSVSHLRPAYTGKPYKYV